MKKFLLEQLVAFAKYGTLSRAAEELHMTQPALSRSMKKIEEEFGIPLFDRDKSKIVLNETGKVAVKYAERVLEADREMIERMIAFERSRRTIAFGACASLPANELMPFFQKYFKGMAITSEITGDDRLIWGLRNRTYQMAVLHERPEAEDIFCRPCMTERLSVTLPADHPLASGETVSFRDLDGISILAHGGAGFWIELCKENLKGAKLLIQDSMDDLSELVDASSLPVFNSDRAVKPRDVSGGRVIIPIADKAAQVTYYFACLNSEKERYSAVFNSVFL